MKKRYLKGFFNLPGSVKWKIIRFFIRKKISLPLSDHDVIWASLFLYLVSENGMLEKKNNIYFLNFNDVKPVTLRIRGGSSSDVLTFFQLYIAKEYKPAFDFFHEKDIKTILDCGANVGYFTVQAHLHFPQAYILAVEPAKNNFQELEQNLKLNLPSESFKTLQAAIWISTDQLDINNKDSEWAYQVNKSKATSGQVSGYPISYFKEVLDSDKIDLLKLDVEGTEDILFQDNNFLNSIRENVKYLVLEIHDNLANRKIIHKKLTECGFEFFEKGELTICAKK